MAEPAGEDDDNSHRQSPRIEEEQLNHSPSPVLPSDHEEEIAEDEIGERLPPPVTPVPRFRNLSAEPANPATPLLLDSGDLPNYSDLSNTSSYRLDNNDLEDLHAENGGSINGMTTTAPRLRKKTISNWRKSGYACLFLTGISLSTAMIMAGIYCIGQESGENDGGQGTSEAWEESRDKYEVILGGLSLFFVIWHAAALLFGLGSASKNCSLLCLHWFMRLCHFGTICLVSFTFFMSLWMFDHVHPNIFEWDLLDVVLLLSLLLAYVMVAYCCIELVVDLCIECFHSFRSVDCECYEEESRNDLLL